jgi:hypothetical protein
VQTDCARVSRGTIRFQGEPITGIAPNIHRLETFKRVARQYNLGIRAIQEGA